MDPIVGSGSAVAIMGLASGLEALGNEVLQIGGSAGMGSAGASRRLGYNLALASRPPKKLQTADLVVGFYMDGFAIGSRLRRYVVCLKGVMADEQRFEAGWTRFRFRLLSRLEAKNARSARLVLMTSEYSRGIAIQRYRLDPKRVFVVPEGVHLPAESGREAPDPVPPAAHPAATAPDPDPAARTASSGGGSGPTILSVARQYPRKNTIALLRAMRAVRHSVPGAQLRVVGGGPRLASLREARVRLGVADCVTLLGELPDEAVRAEYAGADLFCLPSLQEGFGIVFLEAMAAGLPIVACATGAVPEVVTQDVTGLLVPPEDDDALSEALARLARDEGTRARMGRAGRERASRHAWPLVAREFLAAVEPLLVSDEQRLV